MRRIGAGLAGLAAALAVSACDDLQPAASKGGEGSARPAASSYRHDLSGDVSGFYVPATEITAGDWRLKSVFLGQAREFESWETGPKGSFGPVMMEFETADGRSARVLPDSYSVTDGRVRFEGRHPDLGEVAFDARLDQGALATARRNLGDEAPVLTGSARFAGRSHGNLKFGWYGGD